MPKKYLILPLSLLFLLLIVFSLLKAESTYSAANHVVISEVQVGGGIAGDEFVELYNPTNDYVNINGWRLTRKTDTGTQSILVSSLNGLIQPHGYILIAPPTDYDGSVTPDITYSNTLERIAAENTVLLYRDAGVSIVDKVGLGGATDVETTAITNPANNGSVERKAKLTSTVDSMEPGGDDEFEGNGYDTFNNLNDFIARTISNPQNSSSPTETSTQIPVTAPITLYAVLEGNNEVTSVDTTNDGFASLTFNFSENTFDLNLSAKEYQIADLTGAHIHLGAIGAEGAILVDLGQQVPWVQQPANIIRKIITDMQFPQQYIDELLAGDTYINIHTNSNPDGEIRGQLSTQWPPPDYGTPIPTQPLTPVPTEEPTPIPTEEPTPLPTQEPTVVPTVEPTVEPTQEPTPLPTDEPTPVPTAIPTVIPTEVPTPIPTVEPTIEPTPVPTAEPTVEPTAEPTQEPTPSVEPTAIPTPQPTQLPTRFLGSFLFPGRTTSCRLIFTPMRFGFLRLYFPMISCTSFPD